MPPYPRNHFRRVAAFARTLRFRFACWTAGLVLMVMIGFGAFVYFNVEHELTVSLDESLRVNALQALAAIDMENGRLALPETFIEPSENPDTHPQDFVLRLAAPGGQTLRSFGNASALEALSTALEPGAYQPALVTILDPVNQTPLRVYTLPVENNSVITGFIQVGRSLQGRQDTLAHLLNSLLISMPLVILVATTGGYGLAAQALVPIDQITRTARHISAKDFSARLSLPDTNDEVGRLAATFDMMLARLAEAFQRERQFTADAAHELRTPLSVMCTGLDVILSHERDAAEYRAALESFNEEARRLTVLTTSLLMLARADAQTLTLAKADTDLTMLLNTVLDQLNPLAEAKQITLRRAIAPGLHLLADEDRLIQLTLNLVENAIKYTPLGGEVRVEAQQVDAQIRVIVADSGPGIPETELPHIFDRFYRVDRARSREQGGFGLGLAIAKQIVELHRGTIHATSQPGKGAQFSILLPTS